jgi:hypothetical protein
MRIHLGCLWLLAGLEAGCGNPHPSLTSVSPNRAYSGQDVHMTLYGDNLIPATILDPNQGRRIATSDGFRIRIGTQKKGWWQLSDVAWLSPHSMTGWFSGAMAEDVTPGNLDVELVDPRGEKAVLPGGFVKLGADVAKPVVTFESPSQDTLFAPGLFLRGRFSADAAVPGKLTGLDWTYYENDRPVTGSDNSCEVLPGSLHASCAFQVRISSALGGGDVVQIVARAYDDAEPANVAEQPLSFVLRALPTIAKLSPDKGGSGTDIVIHGSGFVPGSQVTFGDKLMFPNGGIFVDANTLSGHAPDRDGVGKVQVVVRSALGISEPAEFEYLPVPQITMVIPPSGPAGTSVTVRGKYLSNARIYFGDQLASAVPFDKLIAQSDTAVVGTAPPGIGSATVWAVDPDLGYDDLPHGYTWSAP